jgi:hypothetical protein
VASYSLSKPGFVLSHSKSSFKTQGSNLSQFANILYHTTDGIYQKNSVFSRFSGRETDPRPAHSPCSSALSRR